MGLKDMFDNTKKTTDLDDERFGPVQRVHEQATCLHCHLKIDWSTLEENLMVCPECSYHHRINPFERVKFLADRGSFEEIAADIKSLNPIDMIGYEDKLSRAQKKSRLNSAVLTGKCRMENRPVVMAVMAFEFMGGSMGSVVGEKIARTIIKGIEEKCPVILFTASGGARMQEGLFSLMQMTKTAHAAALLEEVGLPLFVVLCDPTTGGVTASFAMLGDVTIAEPGALIGFAGPRVIEGTIKEKLPDGFQRAEFQLQKGFVDMIVPRKEMKNKLVFLIDAHMGGQK